MCVEIMGVRNKTFNYGTTELLAYDVKNIT